MNHSLSLLGAAGMLIAQAGTVPPSTNETAAITPSPRIVQADVIEGQHEFCVMNPPLLLVADKVVRIEAATGFDSKELAPNGEKVQLVAFGPGAFFEGGRAPGEIVTISIDEISLVGGHLKSERGQAWKLFDQVGTRLVPKSLQFSLCKHDTGGSSSALARRGRFGSLVGRERPAPENITAQLGAAAAALLDIFGLSVGSFVRIRLSSDPTDAEIYLGGGRQPAKTDTVLDVVAAELPQLSIKRSGFKPCTFNQWTVKFEPTNKRLMTASCKLTPLRGRSR